MPNDTNMTDEELAMRYPQSIIDWEMKHGIVRTERNGMVYVGCARPFEDVCASIDRERRQLAARERMNGGQG